MKEMKISDIKDDLKEIEDYRSTFGHVSFIESGNLIVFCKYLLLKLEQKEGDSK